ncbi:MAG TPA: porin [Luteitalea sp.]|nr:porin [Luteitalea sp.]
MNVRAVGVVVLAASLGAADVAMAQSTTIAAALARQPPATEEPQPAPAPSAPDDAPEPAVVRWRPLPSVRIGSHLRLDVHFRLQFDARDSEAPLEEDEDDTRLDVARRRLGVEGVAFRIVEFEIERELTGDDAWRDVFVNVRANRRAEIQAGHFRLPFSIDQDIGATNRDFTSRSLIARQLAPGRDPGVMVHGRPVRPIEYEVGVFSRDGRNARTRNETKVTGGRTVAWRVVAQPWRSRKHGLEDLEFGVARTHSDVPLGLPALRGETVLESVFFDSDTPVLGARQRTGLQMRWRPGPFSMMSEYIRVTTRRDGQEIEGGDLSPLRAHGWYLSGTWAVTGERKARGLSSPRRPVFRGGPGAIELAARIERITFGSTGTSEAPSTGPRAEVVLPNGDRAATLGVNWYLNRYVKVQANVVRERLDDPLRGPLPSQPSFWSRVLLLQFTL